MLCFFRDLMGDLDLRGSELEIDLESGGNTTEEDESKEQSLQGIEHELELFGRMQSGRVGLNRATRVVEYITSPGEASSSGRDTDENLKIFSDKLSCQMANFLEKKLKQEKRRKSNSKKPCKPPLPPRGPALGTADMMLVKEISELSMLKRRRIERMKVLKRMKSEKASSCDINLWATVFTILFFFVIIFQGFLRSRV